MDPAAPQVTVSVPGRGAGPSEVLTAGPDAGGAGPLKGWVRAPDGRGDSGGSPPPLVLGALDRTSAAPTCRRPRG